MAGIRSTQYPGRWNVPDSNSPQGSAKNRTSPTSNDGSYLDEVWFNDMDSLHQALFIASGITPNGTQDVGTASQIFDALINNRWSAIGNYSVGTIVTASNGKQYKAVQNNGRDGIVVNPTLATDRNTWVQYPYESGSNANGDFEIWHDDKVVCYASVVISGGSATVTFPMEMPNPSKVYIAIGDQASSESSIESQAYNNITNTTFTAFSTTTTDDTFTYVATGHA